MTGPPTARQRQVYEVVERLGSQSAAARELGISQGAVLSAIRGYRRNAGIDEPLPPTVPVNRHRLTQREQLEQVGPRLEAVEGHVAAALAALAEMTEAIEGLRRDIHAWTARQPIYVEMRPRHQRMADGGPGGRREGKALRRIHDDEGAIA